MVALPSIKEEKEEESVVRGGGKQRQALFGKVKDSQVLLKSR